MSRICVKNLPKYVSEDRLKKFFSEKGEVTDAKLMRTRDGKSRQFAFVGFRSEHEAEEAIRYFNRSYLDTCRIACEIARKVGDPDIPRPWSQHSLKKQEKSTKDNEKTVGANNLNKDGSKERKSNPTKVSEEIDDSQLQEFLEIMQPRAKSKLWANDTLIVPTGNTNEIVSEKLRQSKMEAKKKSTTVQSDLDESAKTKEVLLDGDATDEVLNHSNDEVISDMDYFKSRVKKKWSDSECSDEENNDNDSVMETVKRKDVQKIKTTREDYTSGKDVRQELVEEKNPFTESDGEVLDTGNQLSTSKDGEDDVLKTGRLFIRNLPYTANEEELEELFCKYGNVSQVHLVVDKDTRQSKGIAYVLYALPESAARAMEELDGSTFQGRLLHIMPAKLKNPSEKLVGDAATQAPKTLKQRREDEKKASEASGDTQAWNSLFMRPDTVVENIARKYGVSKGDLLDREADDLAVRIALGETQVIAETKKSLINAGVNVSSLEDFVAGKASGMKRSNHVLLVKNLPYGSSESELAKMFGKFGSLDKIILPPTKTLAMVVFLEPAEARAAFKGLAYKRYKDAPLYLEWAPDNVLSPNPTSENEKNHAVGEHDSKSVLLERLEGLADVDVDPDRVESRSIFVKNLNFKTTDESLKEHFTGQVKEGKISSVRVKKHLKNGKNVSMGFGFIEFDSVDTATNVCKDLQGTILDGHALMLQLCHAKKNEKGLKKIDKHSSSTKLIVRNVAFEATEKDLRQLFSPFGQIKSLRLPMKFGNHRGFAFVEFVTKQEAQNALESLSSTHLYGRHLVLERAKEGETLEELRARTAAQFTDEREGFQNSKLSKKRKLTDIFDESGMKFQRITD